MPDWRTSLAGLSSAYATYRAFSRPFIQLHRDYSYVSKSRKSTRKPRSTKRKRTKMPRYRSKRSYGRSSKRSKKYSRRSRKSTRYSSKRNRTPYKRVAARKYGSMYHAKRIKLNPGGFKSREIIRLQDSNTWTATYPTHQHDGTAIIDPSTGAPIVPHVPLSDGVSGDPVPAASLGRCKQYFFRMNDLRNPWNQGTLTVNGSGDTAYNTWTEPALAEPAGADKFNVLKPLPLTHYQTANFRGYTVIGSKYQFKLTNNEGSPAHKVWYAWRVTHVKPGTADREFQFPDSVQKDHPDGTPQTLQDLARTGRWSMGIVNSGSLDKFSSRKVTMNFSSNKLFGYVDGKPGAPNVTGKMTSASPIEDTRKDRTATSPASVALLQFIIGPCNIVDVSDPTSQQFGQPDPSFALQNVRVELKTSHYVALSDPVPLTAASNTGPF